MPGAVDGAALEGTAGGVGVDREEEGFGNRYLLVHGQGGGGRKGERCTDADAEGKGEGHT